MKKKKIQNLYNCLYNINRKCQYSTSGFYNQPCIGNQFCGKFNSSYSKNKFTYSIEIVKDDIYFILKVYNINNSSFINLNSEFCLFFKDITVNGVMVIFSLKLFSLKAYIRFLFNEFDDIINKENDVLTIKIKNPKEILEVSKKPYNSLSNTIHLSSMIQNQNGEFLVSVKIPKQILFRAVKESVLEKASSNKYHKHQTTKSFNENTSTTSKKK